MAQGSPDFRYSIRCIHYSLLPLTTFDRRYTYLLSRILIVCTSSLCRCLTVSYTPVHPLALLFSANPAKSATTVTTRCPVRQSSSSSLLSVYHDVSTSYIFFSPCTRDAIGKAHRYAHAHIFALLLDPDRDFYYYWQRNPFLSLGPGVEASIRRRRRLRATPDPPFPTRAFSWRIRGCDPAVAMPRRRTPSSRRICSHFRSCKSTMISRLSNAMSGKSG